MIYVNKIMFFLTNIAWFSSVAKTDNLKLRVLKGYTNIKNACLMSSNRKNNF